MPPINATFSTCGTAGFVGSVFDATTNLDGVPAGYRGMADRKSLKVLVEQ
ncbi:hypothetical protein ACFY5C_05155 [Streptomyces sp. NPDC012935]